MVQHSTGSGKSVTMAWLGHRLSNLFGKDRSKIFDAVIVVTDRLVISRQLEKLMSATSPTPGKVKSHIDGSSCSLGDELDDNAKFIVTNIQKFHALREQIVDDHRDKQFAVIIDEAHSSTGGELQTALLEVLQGEVSADNVSFYAFTATPKDRTLDIFGHEVDGEPAPFHLYSMKQAREEGFIVDVLQNFLSKEIVAEVAPAIETSTAYDPKTSVKSLVAETEEAIELKARFIAGHFNNKVRDLLDGKARGMVLASSRKTALQYALSLREIFQQRGWQQQVLVAFSDALPEPDVGEHAGAKYGEGHFNPDGISGSEIPRRFSKDHQLLVVADKFQTGFSESKLMAMYVDKPLSGLRAVQTLSRLNRLHRGKGKDGVSPFVVDFRNDPDEIYDAFLKFDEGVKPVKLIGRDLLPEVYKALLAPGVFKPRDCQVLREKYDHQSQGHEEISMYLTNFREAYHGLPNAEKEPFRKAVKSFLEYYSPYFLVWSDTLDEEDAQKFRNSFLMCWAIRKDVEAPLSSDISHITLSEEDVIIGDVKMIDHGIASSGRQVAVPNEPTEITFNPHARRERYQKTLEELVEAYREYVTTLLGDEIDASIHNIADQLSEKAHSSEELQEAARDESFAAYRERYSNRFESLLLDASEADNLARMLLENERLKETVEREMAAYSFGRHNSAA